MILLEFRGEPGAAVYVERGGFMLQMYQRRFLPPYGDGRTWTGGFTLCARGRYLVFRRWGKGL